MNRKLTKGIRITRIVALAMVAAPEPISTALGLCILGVLTIPMLLLRRQNIRRKLYLRHILTEYASSYRPFGFGIGYKPATSASLPYRFGEPQFKTKPKPTVSKIPVRSTYIYSPATTVYHAFDRESALKRFANNEYRSAFEAYSRSDKMEVKPTVFHTFDRSPAPRQYDSGGSRAGYVGYWGRQSYIDIKPAHISAVKSLN